VGVFASGVTPTGTPVGDTSVNLGTAFYVEQETQINALSYYKANSTWDGLTVEMGIWSPSGVSLSLLSRQQQASDPVGWVSISLPSALLLDQLGSGNLYVVAYRTPGTNLGNYAFTAGYFASLVSNGDFRAPVGAGRFDYSGTFQIPSSNTANTAFFADVVEVSFVPATEGSVADRARANMKSVLSIAEEVNESNVDLMRRVLDTPGQTLVTATDASTATHYARYLSTLAGEV
jgi:Domain of unknown function (DUF4082)